MAPCARRGTVVTPGWFERALVTSGLLGRFPMYAGILARMDPVATDKVPVMAVALRRRNTPEGRIQLLVNVEYLAAHPEYFTGVLIHEIQHVVLGHLSDARLHAVENGRAMEIAMELSANEPIVDPLPGGVIRIEMFAKLGIARGQTTVQRYAILAEAVRCGKLRLPHRARTWDSHRPRCDGAAMGPGLGDSLDARGHRSSERNWNRQWGLGLPTIPEEIARMKSLIRQHLRGEHGGADDIVRDPTRRRLAKDLDRFVVESRGGREVDWPRVLASAFPKRRVVHPDYLRPNRRFPDRIGEIPGRARRPPRPNLLVGVDTSGSMNVDQLAHVAHEVRRLGAHATVTIAECDAAVQRVYALRASLGPFVGGGDTDFAPVFEEAGSRFDGVVYFTDGKGEYPERPPPLATLWVLTNQDPFDCPWGATLRI